MASQYLMDDTKNNIQTDYSVQSAVSAFTDQNSASSLLPPNIAAIFTATIYSNHQHTY